ncbi:MAG TPA: hypothetical protein VLA12_13925 [Planctomycetaceae bacterium]|nr:hypothetical protein [Planctomycetaceae bacterium]
MEEVTPELFELILGINLPLLIVQNLQRFPQNEAAVLVCETDLISQPAFYLYHTLTSLLVRNLHHKSPQIKTTVFGVSDRQLAIGTGINGDTFYVELDHENLPVFTREHDGDGEPELVSQALSDFYASLTPLPESETRETKNPSQISITRASAAWKSPLYSIELEEWLDHAKTDPEIEVTNYVEFPNPFKNTIVRKDSPGMAKWKDHAIEYRDGALVLRYGEDILPKARSIAAALDARVEDDLGNEM